MVAPKKIETVEVFGANLRLGYPFDKQMLASLGIDKLTDKNITSAQFRRAADVSCGTLIRLLSGAGEYSIAKFELGTGDRRAGRAGSALCGAMWLVERESDFKTGYNDDCVCEFDRSTTAPTKRSPQTCATCT